MDYVEGRVYRLKTGKIWRVDSDGQMKAFKAPYDFVPSRGEFNGNTDRLEELSAVTADATALLASKMNTFQTATGTPVATAIDISTLDTLAALNLVATPSASLEKIDIWRAQEFKRDKPRRKIMDALDVRRAEVVAGMAGKNKTFSAPDPLKAEAAQ